MSIVIVVVVGFEFLVLFVYCVVGKVGKYVVDVVLIYFLECFVGE